MAAISHHPVTSWQARLVGRGMRIAVRPLLEHAPLTDGVLARLHWVDLVGSMLPLPEGAAAVRRSFGDFDAEFVTGAGVSSSTPSIVLYFHGGAFVAGGLRSHRRLVSRISSAAGSPVLQVNYRQLPAVTLEHTVDDCLRVYRELLDDGYPASRIAFAGDSAGGYLVFAVAHAAIAQGLPVPAAIAALSPWVDLTCKYSTDHPNARTDSYLPIRQLSAIAKRLAPGDDPLLALLEADLARMPPTLIQVGSTEVLRSDAELVTDRLSSAGVQVALQIWDGQIHVFQAAADLVPEASAAIGELGRFIEDKLAGPLRIANKKVAT
ncbi:alpha/beta hydrolase [Antrihabitans spumae]|uniref:Alpha/beta hydrolase n=1 Tax=Antrihabitans spumae TaxID=3373370 RepID=A0ABW7KLE2_9NOCA